MLLLPDYFIHFHFSWTGIFPVFAEAAQHIYVHTKDNLLGSTVHTEVHGPGRQNWRVLGLNSRFRSDLYDLLLYYSVRRVATQVMTHYIQHGFLDQAATANKVPG